jgi:ribosome-associated protein
VPASDRAVELAVTAAEAAAEKLADDILAFDVSDQLVITDVFLLCSAPNDRQVRSIVEEIEERMRRAGTKPPRREGEREGRWILLDYSDVIVHVQHAEERVYYALERLWKDCPLLDLPDDVRRGRDGLDGLGHGFADRRVAGRRIAGRRVAGGGRGDRS